jgi:hypothetical protein
MTPRPPTDHRKSTFIIARSLLKQRRLPNWQTARFVRIISGSSQFVGVSKRIVPPSAACPTSNFDYTDFDTGRDHGDLLATDIHYWRTGCVCRSDEEHACLKKDIADATAKMPKNLQDTVRC